MIHGTTQKRKTVANLVHEEAKRLNIPTAEYEAVLEETDRTPIQAAYLRRNADLDPQLVWRGKDILDWSELVVQAPPLFIQEKRGPTTMDTANLTLETTAKVPVDQLRLDRDNPRLLGEAQDQPDEIIIARLYRSAELNELLESVSTNGYLDIEPLVVTRDPNCDKLIVLEGNRRLATLRLFREPELAKRIESLERLNIKIPTLANESLRSTFDCVSVYPVASREHARSFIGFKHINGPAKWSAYAKARFAADWYKKRDAQEDTLEDIARAIGDRHDTIKRMVSAIYVLDQARSNDLFTVSDRNTRKFSFSHLYTALSRSQYMKYLGLDYTWASYVPGADPVPTDNLSRLKKVLVWIYGSKRDEILPVVRTQNPDIKRLGEVLDSQEGLHVLEVTCDLDAAYTTTVPVDNQFTASLIRARSSIRDAAGTLRAYDGHDRSLLDIAEDIKVTAESVYSSMDKIFRRTQAR